jgi:hypothetical protein
MTALSTTQKIEIIQRAQGLLRERGWVKGEFCDQYGESTAICANGALARAAGRGGRYWHDVIAQFQITIDRLARQNHPASRERELVDA